MSRQLFKDNDYFNDTSVPYRVVTKEMKHNEKK